MKYGCGSPEGQAISLEGLNWSRVSVSLGTRRISPSTHIPRPGPAPGDAGDPEQCQAQVVPCL